ncbi:hypothetical protein ACJJIE_00540 [Microbulbifer sp. TRSA001]|nr:hypothetical protein [Microbulbifer sp. VAAF005]WHI48092.1 hypothetical protein P0078_06845 [Microbulbifer sp. VAAF005]
MVEFVSVILNSGDNARWKLVGLIARSISPLTKLLSDFGPGESPVSDC